MVKKFSREFPDTTIRLSNGTKFRTHKVLLARQSEFFKALFKYNNTTEYILHGIDGRTFNKLLSLVYEPELHPRLSNKEALQLREAADYLLCPGISSFAVNTIKARADHGNIFELCSLSTAHNAYDLLNWCIEYIEANLPDITKTNEFLCIPLGTLKTALHGLRSSPRISEIWNAVGSWVLFDPKSRSKAMLDLMMLARVTQVGPNFEEIVAPVLKKCKFTRGKIVAMIKILLESEKTVLESGSKPEDDSFNSSEESFKTAYSSFE